MLKLTPGRELMMKKTQFAYLSYLLRMRRADNMGRPIWRISLEVPGSETQTYFDNLEAVCTYLAAQMRPLEQATEEKGGSMGETKQE